MTEKEIQEALQFILFDSIPDSDLGEVDEVITFEEAGILTNDKGLVVYLSDGTEIHLTIQGYNKNGQRMN